MAKTKSIIVLLLIVTISVSLLACGKDTGEGSTLLEEEKTTLLVTDSIGRTVEVTENVERIAALYSFAGYAVCLLGSGNNLVAVPGGLQRDILLVEMFPEIANASVPRTGGEINVEELLRIKPDLILVRKDTVTDEKETEKLDNTGIPYIVVDFTTIEEQREAIQIIGKAIGKSEEALNFNKYYMSVIERVSDIVGDIPEKDKVRLLHAENQATRATHETSLVADWTRAAGVINVSVGEDLQLIGNDYYASIEQILLWNPEVIIVNETTAYKLILGHPQWSGISAVQEGKVYQLPNGISRWGHPGSVETPLALLWTVKTVYPERATHINIEEEIYYFYNTFFNMKLDDDMIALILKGGDLREAK
jgi:iron complex transport system substrate-binding protein